MRWLSLLFALVPALLIAQGNEAALLRQYMTGQHNFFHFNGNVLVAKNGKVVYQQALGLRDFTLRKELDENSVFELASLSKQFTAMGIMVCKERGLLNYDDNILRFFPDLPYPSITVRELLTHTSGLPSYEEQFRKYWDHKKIAFNSDVLQMLKNRHDSLFFPSGTRWQYSNTGYVLLASIIEKVSGQSYPEFMKKNIFEPLGLKQTMVYNTRRSTGKIPANYALGYVLVDSLHRYMLPDSLPNFDYVYYLDGIVGDGCVNSTLGDLLHWDQALYANTLVNSTSLAEMQSPLVRRSPTDTTNYYGFGLMVQPATSDGKVVSHSGSWPGYRTQITRLVDKKETIILLSNDEFNVSFLNAAAQSILDGDSLLMPYEHKAAKIDPSLLDRYVGKYSAGLTLEFIRRGDKLIRHRNGTADIELIAESKTKFFYADGTDRQIEFETDPAGNVSKVWFINSGQKGEMKKIE